MAAKIFDIDAIRDAAFAAQDRKARMEIIKAIDDLRADIASVDWKAMDAHLLSLRAQMLAEPGAAGDFQSPVSRI